MSKFELPLPPVIMNHAIAVAEAYNASEYHKYLLQMIQRFDDTLGNEYEVGLRLVCFGQTIVFAVHNIGFQNPSLIILSGISTDGSPIQLIQHVSQIYFLLTSLQRDKKELDIPKRKIDSSFPEK